MNMPFTMPALAPIMPEIMLVCVALILIIVDLLYPRNRELLSLFTLFAGVGLIALLFKQQPASTFGNMFIVDPYSIFFKVICLLGMLMTTLLSGRYLEIEKIRNGEYYSLMMFSVVGMMIMVSGADLIVIYLGLELMALSVYCLVGLLKDDVRANEASIKYFLMGGFSSAILLFGISLLYGMTGTTDLAGIAKYCSETGIMSNPALITGFALVISGFCFKVAAAPFHFWTPDIYQGAPTSITAFMSVAPKAAGFAVFGRFLMVGFPELHPQWGTIIGFIALLSMAVGNIIALSQTNIKRMLAYSSIAHAGYALLGLLSGTSEGYSATMTYMFIYAFMNMGAFAIVILLCSKGNRRESLEDYKGLAKSNPIAALLMLIFMFSLTGIPPTAGFIGKFYLLKSALAAGYTYTVLIAVIFSAISAYFYLRLVRYMYMEDPSEEFVVQYSPGLTAALALSTIGVLGMGIIPGTVLNIASKSLIGF
ncbi:MAG TPA: NADH-quinone oxidoreductase subunit N [Desulfobacterales bacterium]|nr:NADH-quinone oxidoreductase subunit N [Desulfobacterales bacterium]HIP40547.1 NADH-quinone oxidoreductase subunit N [Desulfocapsa sulfexigens]